MQCYILCMCINNASLATQDHFHLYKQQIFRFHILCTYLLASIVQFFTAHVENVCCLHYGWFLPYLYKNIVTTIDQTFVSQNHSHILYTAKHLKGKLWQLKRKVVVHGKTFVVACLYTYVYCQLIWP